MDSTDDRVAQSVEKAAESGRLIPR
jgi:hypothetical protein